MRGQSHSSSFILHSSLASALAANFLLRLAGASAGIMLTLYLGYINRELYPVSATTLGFIVASSNAVEMIFSPIVGAQSDRRGRRWLLVLGPLLGMAMVNLTALTTLLPVLFFTRLLEGLSSACATPPLLSYLAARTEGNAAFRGRVMSLFEAGTALGMALGTVAGSLLWDRLERWGFVVAGGIYLVSAVLYWQVRDADDRRRGDTQLPLSPHYSPLGGLRQVLACGPLLRFMPAWLAVNSVVGLWLTHAVFQMNEGHAREGQYLVGAFGSSELAAILGGYTLVFGVGIVAWGGLIGRLGELRTMRLTLVGMLGAAAMIWVMNHSGGPGPILWLGLAGFVVTVLLESGFAPAAVSYLAELSSGAAENRGLMMGLYSVVLGLGQVLGGWLGGPFADRWGMDGILALTFILGLIAVGLTWTLSSEPVRPAPADRPA